MSPRRWVVGALLLVGCGMMTCGLWIHAKALLAQALLGQAWAHTLSEGTPRRAWPWADHWPVAALNLGERELIVLSDDQGHALAFGPGHNPRTGLPGEGRTIVISGHRDTHFSALQDLEPGASIILQTPEGRFAYAMTSAEILDVRQDRLLISDAAESLVLVTCWPFAAANPGGPLRYAIIATPKASKRAGDMAI